MTKFKVGDRVRCTDDNRPGREFTAGNEYVVTEVNDRWVKMIDDKGTPNGWGIEYFELVEPSGPVREVTHKEIVPGRYGWLNTIEVGKSGASGETVVVSIERRFYGATELREAADIFNQLADALESV